MPDFKIVIPVQSRPQERTTYSREPILRNDSIVLTVAAPDESQAVADVAGAIQWLVEPGHMHCCPPDPRPACVRCGQRWTPGEGVDATQVRCCQPGCADMPKNPNGKLGCFACIAETNGETTMSPHVCDPQPTKMEPPPGCRHAAQDWFIVDGKVINPPLPKRRGEGFRESDVEHATQLVSCFDRAPYRHSRPQAYTRDSQVFRISVSEPSQH